MTEPTKSEWDRKIESTAMNIVYQLDDDSDLSVEFRQANNDKRIDFVIKLLTSHHNQLLDRVMEELEKIDSNEFSPNGSYRECHKQALSQCKESIKSLKI